MLTSNDYKNYKRRCIKRVWLDKNNSSVIVKKSNDKMDEILSIKELGRSIIDNGILIEHNCDLDVMVEQTKQAFQKNHTVYNATFKYDNIYVNYDIVSLNEDKVDIYSIKCTVKIHKKYYEEMALQYYVLQGLGYNVGNLKIIYINKDYKRDNKLEIYELFKVENATDQVIILMNDVKKNINSIEQTVLNTVEPSVKLGEYCIKENGSENKLECECKDYCFKNIPKNSVFDISGTYMKNSEKFELYNNGIVEFKDLIKDEELNVNIKIQIESELNDTKVENCKEIREFITKLKYPVFYLDFETFNPAIPPYNGLKPYQAIPFQYSLHYRENISGKLLHHEFLATEGIDDTRSFAEKLIKDLGETGSIVVYNKAFECTRIKELAEMYDDLKVELSNLLDRIVDLMEIFKKKHYYQKEMRGSFSIKYVLPALFPNDPDLNYNGLRIKNGSMAMNTFSTLGTKSVSEREEIRNDLLKYCRLDTLAMVKILERLEELCK